MFKLWEGARIKLRSHITYGNILASLSLTSLLLITINIIAPAVDIKAEAQDLSDASNPFIMSLSADESTQIDFVPTPTQKVYTGSSSIEYSNTCPHGLAVAMSASSEETGLVKTGASQGTIPTIASGNTLSNNTWGYSVDGGSTYNQIPALSSPAVIADITSETAATQTLNLTYGVKVDNTILSGSYSNSILYTISAKPQCLVFDLKWDLNDGTGGTSFEDTKISYGDAINLQNYIPTKNGYDFAGWKSSATNEVFPADSEAVFVNPTNAGEVTLTAQWTPVTYLIAYTLNGGAVSGNPTSYTIESNAITLANPTRNGYNFTGWTGSNGTTKQTTVTIPKGSTGDKLYSANWTPINYTISYTMNGGSCSSYTNSYTIETNTFSLCIPTRNGYTFAGWTGSNGTTKQTSVSIAKGSTGNKSYTANWTPVNYSISYTLNSGSVSGNPTSYNIETNTITLKNPTRNGYTFAGWTGSNGTTKQTTVTIPKGSTGNKSYAANWTLVNYSISYTLNDGSVWGSQNPTSYTVESNAITLNNPTRSNYSFTGWSGTGLSGSTNQTVTIPKGSTGNRSYTANWQVVGILSISNMQDMTSALCSATESGTTAELTDIRNDHVYTVAKLRDGRCWMTEDLKIISEFRGRTISSSDSNLPSGVTFTLPYDNNSFNDGGYNTNAAYVMSSGSYENGAYYYSFYSATAGWGTSSVSSGSSPQDICPKGWRLPTSDEFGELVDKYPGSGSYKIYDLPGFDGYGGYVSNGHLNSSSIYGGNWWSSSVKNGSQAHNLSASRTGSAHVGYEDRGRGLNVRCIAK